MLAYLECPHCRSIQEHKDTGSSDFEPVDLSKGAVVTCSDAACGRKFQIPATAYIHPADAR